MLGTVVQVSHAAVNAVIRHEATPNAPHLMDVKAGEPALLVKLWEGFEAGSSSYAEAATTVLVSRSPYLQRVGSPQEPRAPNQR